MNTVVFVNATIVFSENLFLVLSYFLGLSLENYVYFSGRTESYHYLAPTSLILGSRGSETVMVD